MKQHLQIVFCIFLFLGTLPLHAKRLSSDHQALVDSLNQVINNPESEDVEVAIAYVGLSEILYLSNVDTVVPLCLKARKIGEKALEQPLDSATKARLLHYMADAINNLGFISERKGDIEASLSYYQESLKVKEQVNDSLGMSTAYNNIALLHQGQESYELALDYFKKSLKLREQIRHKWATAQSHNNLGLVHLRMGSNTLALTHYMHSLELREEIGDKNGIAQTSNNIGLFYFQLDSIGEAAKYYRKSMAILEEIQNKEGMAYVYHNLATIEMKKETPEGLNEALKYAQLSMDVSREIGFPVNIKSTALLMSNIYEKQGEGMKALEMHKLYTEMKDSILNDANQKAVAMKEAQYEYEKKKAIDDLKNQKRIEIEKSKQEQQFIILIIVIVAAIFILLLLIIIYRRLRITNYQKVIIGEQKEEVEAQRDEIENQKNKLEQTHKEITDSIIYAERIQQSILPSFERIRQYLPEFFILYEPKDVVAGDFYWFEYYKGRCYIASADCTGHGVPGALVSVVCSNALSKALLDKNCENVGQILDETRKLVIERIANSGEVKDGMDISLACIDMENMKLEWAGANNPLYLLREGEIQIIKGHREPIGFTENPTPFTKHTLKLVKGDTFYLFTDGYADQFGGLDGKKMGYRRFREKLQKLSHLSMDQQKQELNRYFKEWKGGEEQVDDICVIAIKL